MTMTRLIRSELRKLTTTKMPWAFLAVLAVIAALNAFAVVSGTDMDGSKAFIATEADQQSLMAFAFNAFMGAGLFGAIAVAREATHAFTCDFIAWRRVYFGVIWIGGAGSPTQIELKATSPRPRSTNRLNQILYQ
jgi:hypothetical protein